MKTRVDLVYRALKRLGKLRAGEDPAEEDAAAVDAEIDPLLASLASRGVVFVQDADQIEDEFFSALANRLAGECADDFGVPLASIPMCDPASAEDMLRALTVDNGTDEPIRALYY